MHPAQAHLDTFAKLQAQHPGPAPWTFQIDSKKPGKHAVFSSIVHGNETGSLPALVRFAESLTEGKLPFTGRVSLILGNVNACLKNERFLEADLNRVFTESAPDSLERKRALELMPLLRTADLFVDFHQTNAPCVEPFYIFAFEERSYLWARYMQAATLLVTRSAKENFTANSLCIDEYARKFGIPSVTVELGKAGFTEEADAITERVLHRALSGLMKFETTSNLETLASESPELRFLHIVHREPFTDRTATLNPGYVNLSKVTKGEKLGTSASQEFICPRDGLIMFPKYPKRDEKGLALGPLSGEVYMLLDTLEAHPRSLWGK